MRDRVAAGRHTDPSPTPQRRVVLVVDDEAASREVVTSTMEQDGYCVLTCADGQEGLEKSREYSGPIDLLITNVRMPRLNGTVLCAHLFNERPRIKVIFVVNPVMGDFIAYNPGLPVLTKPIDGYVLRDKVQAVLSASI